MPTRSRRPDDNETAIHWLPSYVTLTRTLVRLSSILLPLFSSLDIERNTIATARPTTTRDITSDLTPQQQRVLRDLLSPLPHHRTRYQHTIEHARTLLSQLEQSQQDGRARRASRDLVQDLAEKRKLVNRLTALVEEAGREAERRAQARDEGAGETLEDLLGLPPLPAKESDGLYHRGDEHDATTNGVDNDQQPVEPSPTDLTNNDSNKDEENEALEPPTPPRPQHQREESESLNLRHRRRPTDQLSSHPPPPSSPYSAIPTATTTSIKKATPRPSETHPINDTDSKTSPINNAQIHSTRRPSSTIPIPIPISNPPPQKPTESQLSTDRETQQSLTSSLLTLATQLKSQSTQLSTHLATTDAQALTSALSGLDSNAINLDSASRKMGLLRRMSEGEGWWGRIMLYVWILGLWVGVVLVVFLGPKFRF